MRMVLHDMKTQKIGLQKEGNCKPGTSVNLDVKVLKIFQQPE